MPQGRQLSALGKKVMMSNKFNKEQGAVSLSEGIVYLSTTRV
jgi:hypothetical protein